jgi:homoserine dehydrogenase
MKEAGIGILGFGTIGQGVARILTQRANVIQLRNGRPFTLEKIYCRNFQDKDLKGLPVEYFTNNPKELLNADNIDTVVELIGGTEIAYSLVQQALQNGKNVVTANKALIATHGEELLVLANEKKVKLLFEASVAGSIPILRILREHFCAGEILKITGILNGTCNYLLSELEKGGSTFEQVLKEAQRLGYAEADSSFDTEGYDAAQKLSILASCAFGIRLPDWKEIPRSGISELLLDDFVFAERIGKRIRLLGKAEMTEHGLFAGVHPRLVGANSEIGKVVGAENMLFIEDEFESPLRLSGSGAGSLPTAMSVLADLGECARGKDSSPFFSFHRRKECVFAPRNQIKKEAYVRIQIQDQVGIVARVADAFAKKNISLLGIFHNQSHTTIAFLLYEAPITDIEEAVEIISHFDFVVGKPLLLSVES